MKKKNSNGGGKKMYRKYARSVKKRELASGASRKQARKAKKGVMAMAKKPKTKSPKKEARAMKRSYVKDVKSREKGSSRKSRRTAVRGAKKRFKS